MLLRGPSTCSAFRTVASVTSNLSIVWGQTGGSIVTLKVTLPMTYYLMIYSADRDPRVPSCLKGTLSPEKEAGYDDEDRNTSHLHWSEECRKCEFPDRLYYVSPEETISLDYYPVADGFLASERMIAILRSCPGAAVLFRDVDLVNEAGEPNSSNVMHFCQVVDVREACDFARMDIDGILQPTLDSSNCVERQGSDTVIKVAAWVSLKDDLPPIFSTREIPNTTLLVNGQMRDRLQDGNLMGLAFIAVEEIAVVDFVSDAEHGFSKTSPHWIERSVLHRWELPVDRSKLFDPTSAEARRMLEQLMKGENL